MSSSPPNHSHSALIFSGSLLRKLENHPSLRLPTTYVGVRRVRPSGGGSVKKLDADGSNGSEHNDDDWTPNAIGNEDQSGDNIGDDGAIAKHNGSEISYKVTNPDGTERRMTKHEKKQLKYKLAQAKREVEREKRQIKHKQLIQEAKKAKYERKKLKRLERQERKKKQQQQQEGDDEEQVEQEQVCKEKSSHDEIKEENKTPEEYTFTTYKEIDEELAAMRGDRSGIPPAMLAPAAACVALDMKALKSTKREDEQIMKTIFDRQLTSEWARELKQSMIPAEELREKEDMRPMAYKVIPELWNRLCPTSLWACKDEEMTARQTEIEQSTDEESTMNDESQHSFGLIRNTSPLYDEVANAVFRHLHKYSNLHISSGEIFGCDFLLYDGKREDRHSFAGLRIYTCDKKDEGKFPIPSAYDMTGFVRTMNTARKLALIATVAKDEGEGDTARVLIVDLALEKVLSVPTHKKKGTTEKRKSEIETSSGLAKHKK